MRKKGSILSRLVGKKKQVQARKPVSKKALVKKTAVKKAVVKKQKIKQPAAGKIKRIAKSRKPISKKTAARKPKTARVKVKKGVVRVKISGKKKTRKRVKKAYFLEDEESYNFIVNIVGNEGLDVVNRIVEDEVSDVELTEKIKLKPNIVRKHLYALYEAGIVTYRRHRSKTGWYTYYWKLHPERIDIMLSELREGELKKLQELLGYEKDNHFYSCNKGCTRAVFDEATEMRFKCQRCEKPLEFIENSERVGELETRITEISKKLGFGR